MPRPNPEHLFDLADDLSKPTVGKPRDANLRRAISTAYYGVFHAIAGEAADRWAATSRQNSPEYALAYRHIDHRRLKSICNAAKVKLSKDFGDFAGHEFKPSLRAVAEAIVELQELRLDADYNPLFQIRISNVRLAVSRARAAANSFWHHVPSEEKLVFLSLLMFKARP